MQLNFVKHSDSLNQPVILFLHGFLGSCSEFNSMISRLDFANCIAIDLPGHGKTRSLEPYTMENTADSIIELIDHLQIDQANLVGYSMGGRLALYLTLNYPDRFPKAVIESSSPGLRTAAERQIRVQRDRDLADQLEADFNQFLMNWYDLPLFRSLKTHPNFEQILIERAKNDPIELARSLREMGTGMQPSLWEKLESHQNPIWLMVGEYDRKFIEINQEMATLCETAKLSIVQNCGHNIHFENLREFVERIENFINQP